MSVNKRFIKKASHGKRPCRGNARRRKTNIKTPR